MKPTHHKTTWQVYTTSELHGDFAMQAPKWAWVAHGPRGSETGVELTADAAVAKAGAASVLLTGGEDGR